MNKSSSSTQKCDEMNLCYPMLLSATEQLESKTEWQLSCGGNFSPLKIENSIGLTSMRLAPFSGSSLCGADVRNQPELDTLRVERGPQASSCTSWITSCYDLFPIFGQLNGYIKESSNYTSFQLLHKVESQTSETCQLLNSITNKAFCDINPISIEFRKIVDPSL